MSRKLSILLISFLVYLSVPQSFAEAQRPFVVTSIRPLALLVDELAGDMVEVEALLDASADPHHFSLRVSDIKRVHRADLLLWLGPDFERFLIELSSRKKHGRSLELGALPDMQWPAHIHQHADDHSHYHSKDMHLWLSPENARVAALAIVEALTKIQPRYASELNKRLSAFNGKITQQQAMLTQRFLPFQNRGIGVEHDGYGHFFKVFGLQQVVAISLSKSQSLSAKKIVKISKDLKSASCLLSAYGEGNAEKLESLFKVPVVIVDPLGRREEVQSYSQLIQDLGYSILSCFESEKA